MLGAFPSIASFVQERGLQTHLFGHVRSADRQIGTLDMSDLHKVHLLSATHHYVARDSLGMSKSFSDSHISDLSVSLIGRYVPCRRLTDN